MKRPIANQNLPQRADYSTQDPALFDLDLMSAVRSDACVLLTGKEDAVRALAYRIHSLSGWRQGPFTIVDCAGPVEIVERVLFGVCADTEWSTMLDPHPVLAQAGTVLLQNVGRLDPGVQSRMADRLIYLCERRRPGRCRCRLMASTSEPLLPRVLDGTFDDRLFYRLNVIHVVVPRDQTMEDIGGVPAVAKRYLIKHRVAHRAP